MSENPFFASWDTPFAAPPFGLIAPAHFPPAFDRAMAEQEAEIQAIAKDPAPPSFANTILALERSGRMLARVNGVFSNLVLADTNAELEAMDLELAPGLARHANAIYLNEALFARIDAVHAKRASLGLDAESLRVLERWHLDFVRAGAALPGAARTRLAAIAEELAALTTGFGQNLLAEEQDYALPLSDGDMAGLPGFLRDALAETAKARGLEAAGALTTQRSSVEPFLQFSPRRDLREKIFKAWTARGDNSNAHDNNSLIARIVALRDEEARLLGYGNFAQYRLDDTMAKTPENARALLERVWKPARARALEERAALMALMAEDGANHPLAAWDWRYYAEKLRKRRHDIDEAEIKPYLQLEKTIAAAFYTAQRLFGLAFRERRDIPVYHPDVRVWEVMRGGETVGLFYGDYFARGSKRDGAWMSAFRDQDNLDGPVLPLIVNVCNFPKGALLSFDEARTLFHEFGHALHGLLSNVRYPRLSGTQVAQDFVELPSQLFEHWLEEPEILERFAVHCETGAPMPRALLEKLLAARNFNKGFETVELLASAFVDLDLHTSGAAEKETLAAIGMPPEIAPRHAAAHFSHVFAGDGYAAGYYSYLWAEVLDADGFGAFAETGDPFDRATARRLHDHIYSAGGARDFAESYRLFRGRDPDIAALLEGRGLVA